MSDTRVAHPDYATDVDEMILDYFISNTANRFFEAYRKRDSDLSQKHVDEFFLQINMLDRKSFYSRSSVRRKDVDEHGMNQVLICALF